MGAGYTGGQIGWLPVCVWWVFGRGSRGKASPSRHSASPAPASSREPTPAVPPCLTARPLLHHQHDGMWLQNVLSRIARVEYEIPKTMSPELQDLLG